MRILKSTGNSLIHRIESIRKSFCFFLAVFETFPNSEVFACSAKENFAMLGVEHRGTRREYSPPVRSRQVEQIGIRMDDEGAVALSEERRWR